MAYDPADERRREYHVAPRYLAGPTDNVDPALRPLLDQGWNPTHDTLSIVHVHAPDRTVRLRYQPAGEDDARWKITAYSGPFTMPRWRVTTAAATSRRSNSAPR